MRVVLVGGAPGVGKTTVARRLHHLAARGTSLVQWVEVDALWLHQSWRVDESTKRMVQSNLAAVMTNALIAGVDVLVVTWVFHGPEMHDLVRRLAPREATFESIQLLVDETTWRSRFDSGGDRAAIDSFYVNRYTVRRAPRPTTSPTRRSSIRYVQLRPSLTSLGPDSLNPTVLSREMGR